METGVSLLAKIANGSTYSTFFYAGRRDTPKQSCPILVSDCHLYMVTVRGVRRRTPITFTIHFTLPAFCRPRLQPTACSLADYFSRSAPMYGTKYRHGTAVYKYFASSFFVPSSLLHHLLQSSKYPISILISIPILNYLFPILPLSSSLSCRPLAATPEAVLIY